MTKEELHKMIESQQPNICQIEAIRNGKQLVSANWIREMTRPREVEGKYFRGMEYGYLWWIISRKKDRNPLKTSVFSGNHEKAMFQSPQSRALKLDGIEEDNSSIPNIYAAIGNSGNVIYVNPEERLVVAVASYFKPTVFDRVDFIQKYIEPFTEGMADSL
jgi:CubicO group peptidase (beta-lactamase class C family)